MGIIVSSILNKVDRFYSNLYESKRANEMGIIVSSTFNKEDRLYCNLYESKRANSDEQLGNYLE